MASAIPAPPPNGFAPPPKGFAPPAAPAKGFPPAAPAPPIPPMFFRISPMSIPPMPPAPPPNGMPPNGLPAPPPNGLPPAEALSLDFFVFGPTLSFVITSTLAVTSSTSSSSSDTFLLFFFFDFFTPSTRTSAKARTNSLFSKKLLVDTPMDSNSDLSSCTFISLHFSFSSLIRCWRSSGFAGAVVLDDVDDDVSGAEDALLLLLETGSFPSFLAATRASTNSDFSKKVLVEIPYDSSSCLIAPILMDLISSSMSALLNK
mmetsp:Transcript_15997/g.26227  ORF Transcript_15997/g.26227 Transcript_15997/m.26227 type:complete len:260 (-) Transcript_15997:235-1014(-)